MLDTHAEIALAGDGWGAIAALKSLQRQFQRIAVITADTDVDAMRRSSDRAVRTFDESSGTVAVCSGFNRLLPPSVLGRKIVFINVHYALLPKYRGHHAAMWAILNGETTHGMTIHLMDARMDAGPVLLQRPFTCEGMNSREMIETCNQLAEEWLGRTVIDFLNGRIVPQPQDESMATWCPRRNLDDCVVDFESGTDHLLRLFRALVRPYPLPMLRLGGALLEISSARVLRRPYLCTIGSVVNVDDSGAYIKVGDGLLVVEGLLRDGAAVRPQEVLRIGQRL